jgi:DNA-binding IclR family transcriptional regulator
MSVIAVERALILLRYIIENENGLSIREASRNLGYSPATVHKLINALNSQGYVTKNELTDRYILGPEAVQLGLTALSRLDVRQEARPHLEALSSETGETAFLAIARGDYAIYVDKAFSDQPISIDAPLGVERPYNCTAVGKVLLSGFEDEKIENLSNRGVYMKMTENSITDFENLIDEVNLTRAQGWARDNEEFASGFSCIAAPVFDNDGKVIAALTVSGPAGRISEGIDNIVEQVRFRAEKISERMGYVVQELIPVGKK